MMIAKKRIKSPRVYLAWLGRHELAFLVSILMIAAALWGVFELAEMISGGGTASFDEKMVRSLRNPHNRIEPIGPRWLQHGIRDISGLGGYGTVAIMMLSLMGYLILQKQYRYAVFVCFAVLGAILLAHSLKFLFTRPRPDYVIAVLQRESPSFPSGHAVMAASVYLTLGALLAKLQHRWILKTYVLLTAVFITVLIGFSRVYLAMHWPTDVFAGWTLGCGWAIFWWSIARLLQKKGMLN